MALIALSLGATAGLALAAPAAMAASPPTVTSAFTPNLIGLSDTSATSLSVTIANPNASGTLSAVSFTDTLPAGLTIDNPNGENGTCGSSGVITASARLADDLSHRGLGQGGLELHSLGVGGTEPDRYVRGRPGSGELLRGQQRRPRTGFPHRDPATDGLRHPPPQTTPSWRSGQS